MLSIAENTCVKFERRGGEADYVDLKNERGEGCYTMVGRSPGRNVVMLETNEIATCLEYEIVIHELMHTIGLWHEQMRYDRDDYIKVHWENIGHAYLTQFEKVPETDSTTYGVKYDYQSVMHYAKDAFASTPGRITMETLNKQYQDIIGKVKDAAPSDYLKICNIYSCQTCMGRPFISGQNKPEIGQRVLTLGPWPVTLPTGSPSPATLPLIQQLSSRWPTPQLPIILPLINNNWWWKNTPAPPFHYPQMLRKQINIEQEEEEENEEEEYYNEEIKKEEIKEKNEEIYEKEWNNKNEEFWGEEEEEKIIIMNILKNVLMKKKKIILLINIKFKTTKFK
ncbi:Metalloendopeptidase [Meloidogyne graminicola]|uniref:Metalloendopeptidase n=1 Tax=Meloidogyne graminicola TaxID=189291 RepID=A0A8S9ZK06_9BILA|nr:Metalloendopeptidase [Meloidogyne graminicola]